jgi:hypothetical protein
MVQCINAGEDQENIYISLQLTALAVLRTQFDWIRIALNPAKAKLKY